MKQLLFTTLILFLLNACSTANLLAPQDNLLDEDQQWKPINSKDIQKEMMYV